MIRSRLRLSVFFIEELLLEGNASWLWSLTPGRAELPTPPSAFAAEVRAGTVERAVLAEHAVVDRHQWADAVGNLVGAHLEATWVVEPARPPAIVELEALGDV